jgi:hypothetical protein
MPEDKDKKTTNGGAPDNVRLAKMKATLARAAAMGNKAAIRMTKPSPDNLAFKEWDGMMGKGTHYMASMGRFAVPFIQEGKDGKLFFNKNASPDDKEAIQFDSEEDAQYFAEHYKEIAPMMKSSQIQKNEPKETIENKETSDVKKVANFAVDYMDVDEKGDLFPTTQTFETAEEADAFMEERKKSGKFYGSGMKRRGINESDTKIPEAAAKRVAEKSSYGQYRKMTPNK